MFNKDDLKNNLLKSFAEAKTDEKQRDPISEHLTYLRDHYKDMTPDAQVIADKTFDMVMECGKETIDNLPDDINKRKASRIFARLSRKHWSIEPLVNALDAKSIVQHKVIEDTKILFLEFGQIIADWLYDSIQKAKKGYDIPILTLFHLSIDELLVALSSTPF